MLDGYDSLVSFYINEVITCVTQLRETHAKYYSEELLFAYRGESKDYGRTKLQPSIFRDPTHIRKEAHLFELLCDYNLVYSSATNIEKAIESQHYISISRMLDITFSALSSLYFACEGNKQENANLFVFGFPKHYSPHSNYIQNFYDKILNGEDFAYSRNFKVFSHSYSNDRIQAQKGGFIFFSGKDFIPINECYYKTVVVSAEHKAKILMELNLLFQINVATIYPEKENTAKIIKEKFENNDYDQTGLTVTLDNEITNYFERLNYELRLTEKDNKTIQRILRKEKNDLLSFVRNFHQNEENQFDNSVLEKSETEIKDKFLAFTLMFKEA